jgi:hypothetical protein
MLPINCLVLAESVTLNVSLLKIKSVAQQLLLLTTKRNCLDL